MGSITPVPYADEHFINKVENKIITPTLNGLREEEINYKGFLYFGLMKVDDEPYVIEYNVRMGDPETQPVLCLLKSDLLTHLNSIYDGTMMEKDFELYNDVAVAVILASEGYPGSYEKGKRIDITGDIRDSIIFHAGTKLTDKELFTAGGRVMAVTAKAQTFEEAMQIIYRDINKINFQGKYFRKDIGRDI
jgi:phosphoribosylamine--glycine ligase